MNMKPGYALVFSGSAKQLAQASNDFGIAVLLAVVAIGPRRIAVRVAGWSFAAGIVLFSGSLFMLAAGAARWVGWMTPFGGVALIIGWAALATLAVHRR